MKQLVFIFTLFNCLTCFKGYAQGQQYSVGQSSLYGQTGTALKSAFSVLNNPATLSFDSISIGLASTQHFLIEGLNTTTISACKPSSFGAMGFGFTHYGDANFNEINAVVGANRLVSEKTSIGLSLLYVSSFAQFAGRKSTVLPQVGFYSKLSENFSLGSTIRNPFSQKLKAPFDKNRQSWMSIGTSYFPSQEVNAHVQVDILEQESLSAGFGLEYELQPKIIALAGGRLKPSQISFGLQVNLSEFQLNLGSQHQSGLGFSPSFIGEKKF